MVLPVRCSVSTEHRTGARADDRARTGDLNLGKVVRYQLRYVRVHTRTGLPWRGWRDECRAPAAVPPRVAGTALTVTGATRVQGFRGRAPRIFPGAPPGSSLTVVGLSTF